MKRICVFCGSSSGKSPIYLESAKKLGKLIAQNGFELVYGGASIGVMGAIADAALENGGKVIGVMPSHLIDWEVSHKGLTEFISVDSMHERKEKMYELSDYFVSLPGGMGTLDEMCEIITWAQLKLHQKHTWLVDVNGFYKGLWAHFEHAIEEGFIRASDKNFISFVASEDELIEQIKSYE